MFFIGISETAFSLLWPFFTALPGVNSKWILPGSIPFLLLSARSLSICCDTSVSSGTSSLWLCWESAWLLLFPASKSKDYQYENQNFCTTESRITKCLHAAKFKLKIQLLFQGSHKIVWVFSRFSNIFKGNTKKSQKNYIINSFLNSVIEVYDVRETIGNLTINDVKRNINSSSESNRHDLKTEVTNKSYEHS